MQLAMSMAFINGQNHAAEHDAAHARRIEFDFSTIDLNVHGHWLLAWR